MTRCSVISVLFALIDDLDTMLVDRLVPDNGGGIGRSVLADSVDPPLS